MESNPFIRDEAAKSSSFGTRLLIGLAIVVSLAAMLYLVVFSFNEVEGPSMQPNFESNELLLVSRAHVWFDGTFLDSILGLNIDRGDVIVFEEPQTGRTVVKRIIGLPGEQISIRNGVFTIDGTRYVEGFETNLDTELENEFLKDGGSGVLLTEDEYFIVGDNRLESIDSRDIGPIKKDWIIGKAVITLSDGVSGITTGTFNQ